MAEKTIATTPSSEVPSDYEETREKERYLTPAVDIYEEQDDLNVVVDIPGVGENDADIRVENGILTIEGKTNPSEMGDSIFREYKLAHYFRQFKLSDAVDQERIQAEIKNGVLTLQLPKKERAKPKQIDVRIAT